MFKISIIQTAKTVLSLADKIEAFPAEYKLVVASAAAFANDEVVNEGLMCASFNFSRARASVLDNDIKDATLAIDFAIGGLERTRTRLAKLAIHAESAALLA